MPSDCISYQNSGYFTALIIDYLNQKPELQELYNRFPTIENFKQQIEEKRANYNHENREVLVSELLRQYQSVVTSDATAKNIAALHQHNTYTVTTGHQLNLFTGPLYFLYKIISAIKLCEQLKEQYPENVFVPIYWMATEDHDFEEINYFTFHGKKFRWNRESTGAVGKLDTGSLEELYQLFSLDLGLGAHANRLRTLFENAYLKHPNLTDATRYLANELFGAYGLVILDADSPALKKCFVPYAENELFRKTGYEKVTQTNELLKDYTIQVNPREINLFYMTENLRERIVLEENIFTVNNTAIRFTETEIRQELHSHPERFSPNVITRPLYEEILLPNLCYIGGGGEIAYWLQLKSFFEASNVTFPILLIRNSVLLATEKQYKKADALNLSWADLFLKQNELLNRKIRQISEFEIDLTPQKQQLQKQFEYLLDLAKKTDQSFTGAVLAQQAKQMKGLENLEKQLLKAQKRKHNDELERMTNLQNSLFPYQGLQERQNNFSEFYLIAGDSLIPKLLSELIPLETEFKIIVV